MKYSSAPLMHSLFGRPRPFVHNKDVEGKLSREFRKSMRLQDIWDAEGRAMGIFWRIINIYAVYIRPEILGTDFLVSKMCICAI